MQLMSHAYPICKTTVTQHQQRQSCGKKSLRHKPCCETEPGSIAAAQLTGGERGDEQEEEEEEGGRVLLGVQV